MKNLRKINRHKGNPIEKRLHHNFINHCNDDLKYSLIAFPSLNGHTPIDFVNEREINIMINTIQWLGSNVGRKFLEDNGFTLSKIDKKLIQDNNE